MNSQPRNRLVVFRLSDEEYRTLMNVCERNGGRNLADFTRAEVLEYLQACPQGESPADTPQHRVTALEREVAGLRTAVTQLNQLVSGTGSRASEAPAARTAEKP